MKGNLRLEIERIGRAFAFYPDPHDASSHQREEAGDPGLQQTQPFLKYIE